MSTTQTVLLITVTSLLSIFIVMCIAVTIVVLRLITNVKHVVTKAEHVVNSVESASDVFKNIGDKASIFKLIKNIVDIVGRKK